MLIVNTYLHKYFKARSTSIKVIQITFTEANFTIIYALADDKKTPSPSQSSRKRYEDFYIIDEKLIRVMFHRLKYFAN